MYLEMDLRLKLWFVCVLLLKSLIISRRQGLEFEKRVERMFRRLGYWHVARDVRLKDSHGNVSQIDLRFGLLRKTYVECKCYSDSVPLKDVAKFAAVLELNGIPLSRGLFITNSTYVPRATTIGIKTLDGIQFARLERRSQIRQRVHLVVRLSLVTVALAGIVYTAMGWAPVELSASQQSK